MVLPLHLPNKQSSAYRRCTVIGNQMMSSRSDMVYCKTWLTDRHHQWQRNKIRCCIQRVESIHERTGIKLKLRVNNLRNRLFESLTLPETLTFWKSGKDWFKFKMVKVANLNNWSLTNEVLRTAICLAERTLNSRPQTTVSDDPENLTALSTNHFTLWHEGASAPFRPSGERYHDLRKSFKRTQAYADKISKWWKRHARNLYEGELEWLVDNSVKRWEFKWGRILEIFTGNDEVVRSARVKMAHGELNRQIVSLAPVFYNGVAEIKKGQATLAPLQISYKSHQTARNNFWYRKNRENLHTPIFGREDLRNPRFWQTVRIVSRLFIYPTKIMASD